MIALRTAASGNFGESSHRQVSSVAYGHPQQFIFFFIYDRCENPNVNLLRLVL